jgi:putative CocE/NonD family hydrolase
MSFELQWGVRIPLRDGIHLHATLYRPKNHRAPAPCIVALTPYIADSHHERGVYFATHGLSCAIVDVRGRGNSEGAFHPKIHEAQDGYDVVEWLARQPWCNGQIAMCGASYLGYCQWATAKELPSALATIIPTAAPYSGVDVPMRNNIFYPERLQWIALISGRTGQSKVYSDHTFWSAAFREWHESGRSFRDVDTFVGARSPLFQDLLSHPEPDAYWDAQSPTPEQYAQMKIPVLTITGSYDDCQPGALEYYRQHMRRASSTARERHYLIIGPWNHAGTVTPRTEFGGLKLDAASVIDIPKLHVEWYAWILQGGPRPVFLQKKVAYYVMGAERWRYADSLDEVTASHRVCYLDSKSNANDVFGSGSLGATPGTGQPDAYTYDPRNTQGPHVEAESLTARDSLVDQRVVLALSGRQLVYHSEPFERDTEITGFFKLSAWIAIDCPDTDLYATIYEISDDGTSLRLSTDAIRARYRQGLRTPKLIHTGDPLRYDFERFTFVSRLVRGRHRLRLCIAPVGRLIEGAFTQKNYNAGGVVSEESVQDARPVTVKLFHDSAHPSALYLPLGRDQSG